MAKCALVSHCKHALMEELRALPILITIILILIILIMPLWPQTDPLDSVLRRHPDTQLLLRLLRSQFTKGRRGVAGVLLAKR